MQAAINYCICTHRGLAKNEPSNNLTMTTSSCQSRHHSFQASIQPWGWWCHLPTGASLIIGGSTPEWMACDSEHTYLPEWRREWSQCNLANWLHACTQGRLQCFKIAPPFLLMSKGSCLLNNEP